MGFGGFVFASMDGKVGRSRSFGNEEMELRPIGIFMLREGRILEWRGRM